MTNGIRRWLGLAIVPLTLLMLGVASPVLAQNETHKCDGDPNFPTLPEVFDRSETNPENGPIIIRRTDGQDCTISATEIFASQQIDIQVFGGSKLIFPNAQNIRSMTSNVDLQAHGNDVSAPNADIKAGNLVRILAGVPNGSADGSIATKDVISNYNNVTVGDANILIRAQKDVNIGEVRTTGDNFSTSLRSGSVQIDANLGQLISGDITIGSGGNIEKIDIRSINGGTDENGQPNPFKNEIGVRVTNGTFNSTGNITLSDPSALQVRQTQSRSGRIELNANKGDLIIGDGIIDTSSQNNKGGGNVYLLAKKIQFTGEPTIDNSQEDAAPGIARQIILAASTIDYKAGFSLDIQSGGNGISNTQPATVYILPHEGILSTSSNDVVNMTWTVTFNGSFFFYNQPLHFDGGTTANLNVQADGDAVQIAITGNPITFNGKDVLIQTKGDHSVGKHEIVMGYFGPATQDATGIDFSNTGETEFFVRGEGTDGDGGDIQIETPDKVNIASSKFNLKANGPANKSGDGGTITFVTSGITVADTTKVKFLADASNGSTGKAQTNRFSGFARKAVFFNAGESTIPVGDLAKQFSFSARGGMAGGDGGAIEVIATGSGNKGIIRIRPREKVIDVSARGANGSGGNVILNGKVRFVPFATPLDEKVSINAIGGTTGNGGRVELTQASTNTTGVPIFMHARVKVDGGENQPSNSLYGSIKSNGLECQQYKTAFSIWPKTFWDCNDHQNLNTAESNVRDAAGGLESDASTFSTLLSGVKDNSLSVFKNNGDFNTFFGAPADPDNAIVSGLNIDTIGVLAVFAQDASGGDISQSMRGAAMHEIGHFVNVFSSPDPAQNPPFTGIVTSVKTTMENPNTTCLQVFNSSTFCGSNNTWDALILEFIGAGASPAKINEEMFAFGFQQCSGFDTNETELNFATTSSAAFDPVRTYMNGTLWPQGCRP